MSLLALRTAVYTAPYPIGNASRRHEHTPLKTQ